MFNLLPYRLILLALLHLATSPALAQSEHSAPPAVVVTAERRPITEQTEIMGRIEAPHRVDLAARVTAFLDEQFFEEGATGDQDRSPSRKANRHILLYNLMSFPCH